MASAGLVRVAAALSGVLLVMGCAGEQAVARATYPTVASAGILLHTRVLGNGKQVIVLLHGGPGLSLQEMAPFDALLTPARQLVSFDQRGSGATGLPVSGDVSLQAQVGDIEAIRHFTGASRVWLVGQSWGGLLAGAYAAVHPDRVAGLALIDAAPPDLTAFDAGQRAFALRLAHLQGQGIVPAQLPAPTVGSCLPALRSELPAYAADPARPPRQPTGVSCTAGTAQRTYAAVLRPEVLSAVGRGLADYRGPALIVSGTQDPFGPLWPQAWTRLLSQAHALTMTNAGHEPVLEQPDILLKALNRFLEQNE